MTDTQWPRYLVFEQPKPGKPFQHAGSVHAPDSEMALQNARDVFSRRPDQVNLWVVLAAKCYARTKEELVNNSPDQADDPTVGRLARYLVFKKNNHRGFHTHAGVVEAASPSQAMKNALASYPDGESLVWWVIPERDFNVSTPEEAESFFSNAEDKPYRHATDFKVVTLMREIKRRHEQD